LGSPHAAPRLSWSPDGQWLAAANAYAKSTQSNHAKLFKRDNWGFTHCFVGHTSPVVAVRPNPKLWHTPRREGGPLVARGTGSDRAQPRDLGLPASDVETSDEPTVVFALASMDKQFSVWASARASALMVGSGVSKLGLLDAAWTPDGYNLILVALDGSIVTCRCGVGGCGGWGAGPGAGARGLALLLFRQCEAPAVA
jgi:WD40 repeat protein